MATSHTVESRTTFANALKYAYKDFMKSLTPEHSATLNLIKSKAGTLSWGGKSLTIAARLNFMGSSAAIAESGDLPDSTPVNIVNTIAPIVYNYFSVSATGPAMATSREANHAFAEAWAEQVLNKHRAFRQHRNRQMLGDGNGYLAQVDGTPSLGGSDYTVTLDNASGISGFNNSAVNGARFISTNMKVDFYSGSSKRDNGGVKITSWTQGAFPSTSATAVFASGDCDEVADGDYMLVAGAYGNEMAGLRLLIDDTTIASTVQSLSSSTYSEWRSKIGYGSTPGTAEALTRMRMMQLWSDVVSYGGGNPGFMITSPGVWLTYGDVCKSESIMMDAETMDNGFKAWKFNGIPVYMDVFAPDEIYMVDPSTIYIAEAQPEGWLEFDDGIIKQVSGKDEAQAYWCVYDNLCTDNRAANGKMVDITVTANQY